ncbi:MAG: deoxyribose-phosphate aldolase [Erysipelotrichaceae bacterium]|nr:deoxyribose-phosphate aldolase [Erysipelotrichaceae bacterium]
MKLTKDKLCKMFDHTFLKAYATKADFEKLCNEARTYGFAMVAINSYPVKLCKQLLKGTDVHVGAAIAFPLGQMSIEAKRMEAELAIEDGADEIDYVLNIGKVKEHDYDYIKEEMKAMVNVARKHDIIVKVILENCYLEKDEITEVSRIAKEVKPDFIKTSTGFGPTGATIEDVKLMKAAVGDEVKVKAAGGIRDYATCKAMIEAGAERIGTSSSIKILEEYLKENDR